MRKFKAGFIFILAMLISINGALVPVQAAGAGSAAESPEDTVEVRMVQVIAGGIGQKAGEQADPKEEPAVGWQVILVKVVGSNGDKMMKVVTEDLVLDVAGCIYEPRDKESLFVIKKNVLVTAGNIMLTDAVVEGDVHVFAENTTLRNLDVKGTIYIDPVRGNGLKLDNVTAGNVAIWLRRRTGNGNGAAVGESGAVDGSDAGDTNNAGNADDIVSSGDGSGAGNSIDDTADVTGTDKKADSKTGTKAGARDNAGVSDGSGIAVKAAGSGNGVEEGAGNAGGAANIGRTGNTRGDADIRGDKVTGSASDTTKTRDAWYAADTSNDEYTGDASDPSGNPAGPVSRAYMTVADIDSCDSYFVIVNKTRILPADWKPDDLVRLQVTYSGRAAARYLRKEASDALAEMFAAARKEGIELCAVSGFRSYELQQTAFNKHVSQMGLDAAMRVSAMPGRSEHQTGLAIDISSGSMGYSLSKAFANTREGKWLAENAARFGFIMRYPEGKEGITGYDYEPWHFRYVGRDAAMDIAEKGMTLEEYFGLAGSDGEPETPPAAGDPGA